MKYKRLIIMASIVALTALFFAGQRFVDKFVDAPLRVVAEPVNELHPEHIAHALEQASGSAAPARQEKPKGFVEPLGLAALSGPRLPAADAPAPQTVSLRLADGSQLDFMLTGKEVRGDSNYSWSGEVAGQPGSMVMLTRYDDAVDGYIMTLDRGELQVTGRAGEPLTVERLHLEQGFCGTCAADHKEDVTPARFQSLEQSAMARLDEGAASEPVAAGANPVIDMMVVYSPRAALEVGGVSAVNAKINTAITSLNNTLAASEVALTIRLVHVEELDYLPLAGNDGGVSTALGRLANGSDGYVDEAHILRNTYGADLVAFMIDEDPLSSYGVAYINNPWSCIDAATFSGVAPHEWGHNLGCGHNDSGAGQSTLQGVYSYSYAHYFDYNGGSYGTIMSYINQGASPGGRIARFSNPDVDWNGIATGTANRNHALTIENTKTAIGGWRTLFEGYGGKPYFWFETDDDFEGWSVNNISNETVSGGVMSGIATSGDPQLSRSGLNFPGADASTVLIRMQAEINSTVDLFWGHTGADTISTTRKITVSYTGSGDPQVLTFDLSSDTNWTAKTITQLRLDPLSLPPATGKSFSIDWIAITDGDFDSDGIADTADGYGDTDGDGLPDFADTESDGDGTGDADEAAAGRNHTDAGDMAFHFNTDGDFEGWTNSPMNVTGLAVSNGVVSGTASTADPYFANNSVGFVASQVPTMTVRMRAGANGLVQLYWAPLGGGFAGNFVGRNYTGSGGWQVVEFPMAGNANWDGNTIDKLRIDPIGSSGAWFEIDWIRSANGDGDFDGFPDLVEGTGDSDSDGTPDYLDEDSDGDGFLDWEEYLVGTDRTNAAENALLISVNGVDVVVEGKTGRIYRLLAATNLVAPVWGTVDTQGPLPSDQAVTFTNSPTGLQEFYRVQAELP